MTQPGSRAGSGTGKSRVRLAAVLLAVGLLVSACGSKPSAQTGGGTGAPPPAKKTLRIGIPSDVVTLDPHLATDLYSAMAYTQIFEPVVTRDLLGNPAAALATAWHAAPDNITWTFTMRPNVKFQDSTPMTLDDVKYSLERIMDKDFGSPRQAQFAAAVEAVTTQAPDQLIVKLKKPNAAFLSLMAYAWVVPKHAAEPAGKAGFTKSPVGTGPYKFVERKPDDHTTLAAFAGYWGGKPEIDEVLLRPITDASTRTVELQSGGVDLMPSIAPADIGKIKNDPKLAVVTAVGANYRFIYFNTEKAPFNDARLRQAVAYAINKQQVIDTIYPGVAQVAAGPVPPMSFVYDQSFKGIEYNPDKAKALLKDIGNVPPIEYMISSGDLNQREGQLIQSMLAAVGFKVTLKPLDFGALMAAGTKGDYQMARLGWTTTPEPNDLMYNRYHTNKPDFNASRYSNAKVDQLLEQGLTEQVEAKRAELYRQAQQQIVADVPEFHMFHESRVYGLSQKVQGFQAHYGGEILLKVPSLNINVTLAG